MSLKTKRGDTIMEVTIAITVFCIVSIISMGIMDRDLNSIQGALELEMTRNEIDSQAEALRFIHDSYLSEHEYSSKEYETLWKLISRTTDDPDSPGLVNNPANISPFSAAQCPTYYDTAIQTRGEPHNIFIDNAFVINTRNLDPSNLDNTIISTKTSPQRFISTPLYPRIVYTANRADTTDTDTSLVEGRDFIYDQVGSVEGVWVIATRDATDSEDAALVNSIPEFYDYHIRSCWYSPNRSYPTTIATIIRLYNPDFEPIEEGGQGPAIVSATPSTVYTPGGETTTFVTNISKDTPMTFSPPAKIGNKNCLESSLTTNGNYHAISCKTPPNPGGNYDVSASVSIRGEASITLTRSNILSYVAPKITSVSPQKDLVGGSQISIATNIPSSINISIAGVRIGNSQCTNSSTSKLNGYYAITCKAPSLTEGNTYSVFVDISIRGGSQTTLEFKSVTYKKVTPQFFTITYMQEMNNNVCNSVEKPKANVTSLTNNNGSNYSTGGNIIPSTTLIDQRDGQVYTVRKLADGNCWMTENLRYGATIGGAARAYNSADAAKSDNMNATNMAKLTKARICNASSGCKDGSVNMFYYGTEGYTNPQIMIYQANTTATYDGKTKYGVMYNYCAVTGGTACTASGTAYNPTGSVCPKGWKLPGMTTSYSAGSGTGTTDGSVKTYDNVFNLYGVTSNIAGFNKIIASPFNFVSSGYAYGGSLYTRSSRGNGYCQLSTSYTSSTLLAYHLMFNGNGVIRASNPRYYGYPARCVSS